MYLPSADFISACSIILILSVSNNSNNKADEIFAFEFAEAIRVLLELSYKEHFILNVPSLANVCFTVVEFWIVISPVLSPKFQTYFTFKGGVPEGVAVNEYSLFVWPVNGFGFILKSILDS